MPPLQDITSSVLRENSLRENIQPQRVANENEFLRALDENSLVGENSTWSASTPNRRQASRSRSLPGSSIGSISPNNRRSCNRFPSLSAPKFYEDSMSKKFDLLILSNGFSSSFLDDDVFDCCCSSAKKKANAKRRYSMPLIRKLNSEIIIVKLRNKKVAISTQLTSYIYISSYSIIIICIFIYICVCVHICIARASYIG